MENVHYRSSEEVQFFLDHLAPMQEFTVIFTKKDGTQRQITGYLDPNGITRKSNPPVMTDEGWKSFNIGRVLSIM